MKTILANLTGKAVSVLLAFFCTPLYVSFLGIEAYGVIGFYYSLLSVVAMFGFGLTSVITRELARRCVGNVSALLGTFEIFYLGIGLIIVLCFCCFPFFLNQNWLSTIHSSRQMIGWMGIALALQSPYCLYEAALIGLQKQIRVNLFNGGFALARSLGSVVILWLSSPTLISFFFWQVIVSLVQAITFRWSVYQELHTPFHSLTWDKTLIRDYRKMIGESGSSFFLSHALTQIDKLILSRMVSLESFGYYCLAGSVCNVISYVVLPITQALYPLFSLQFARNQDVQRSYALGMRVMICVLIPLGAVLFFFSKEILQLWTHDAALADRAYRILSLLALVKICEGLIQLPWTLSFAYGWRKIVVYQQLISFLLIVPVMVKMVRLFGVYGSCYTLLGIYFSSMMIGILMIHRKILRTSI